MKSWFLAAALAAVGVLACALPARAADNYPIRDGSGALRTFCSVEILGVAYPCHLKYGLDGPTPRPIRVDGVGNQVVSVTTSALPAGAATAANQATGNGALGDLRTSIGAPGDATWSGEGGATLVALQRYVAEMAAASRALLAAGAFFEEDVEPLEADASATGASRDVGVSPGAGHGRSYFNGFFLADASGMAELQCSSDGENWMTCASEPLVADTPLTLSLPVMWRYHRARVVNGGDAQSSLIVATSYTGS